jgi:predicted nucleic acid-binding protein
MKVRSVRIVLDTNLLVSGIISPGGPPLLPMGHFNGIPIVTAREAVDRLAA